MSNLFKRAALALGRCFGVGRDQAVESNTALIEPVVSTIEEPTYGLILEPTVEQAIAELPPVEGNDTPWSTETDSVVESITATEPHLEVARAAVEPMVETFEEAEDKTYASPLPVGFATQPQAITSMTIADDLPAPVEVKPDPTFQEIYDLISTDMNKRLDNSVAVYERLVAATREELEATRRNNRLAWSVGGVMTAVAAFGGIWASGEVSATHTEVGSLKQMVVAGKQAIAERDQLRTEMLKAQEATAKLEIGRIKARLDEALAVTTERDRLREQVESLRKAKQDVEVELKVAKASATTQPVSDARRASEKLMGDKAAGSERTDVWSVLLNGKE